MSREEKDQAEILSGVFDGKTTGTPLAIVVRNQDGQPGAYDSLRDIFRPGHADFTYWNKYGIRDHRGGGRASGRETAARVAAGAVARALINSQGIKVLGYTVMAGGISCQSFTEEVIEKNPLRACDSAAAVLMEERILLLAAEGNSCGGIVEVRADGLPPGLGEPVFSKLDALIAQAVLSVGGIKGIEFGSGFACADSTGDSFNDPIGKDGFLSNHAGGVLGGISTGQPLIFRAAVKPTPSISLSQKTIDKEGKTADISVAGRHDPCLCPRIVPVLEAMTCLVLADLCLISRSSRL